MTSNSPDQMTLTDITSALKAGIARSQRATVDVLRAVLEDPELFLAELRPPQLRALDHRRILAIETRQLYDVEDSAVIFTFFINTPSPEDRFKQVLFTVMWKDGIVTAEKNAQQT